MVEATEKCLGEAKDELRQAEERFARQGEDYQGWRDELDGLTRRRQELVAELEERKKRRKEGWELGINEYHGVIS